MQKLGRNVYRRRHEPPFQFQTRMALICFNLRLIQRFQFVSGVSVSLLLVAKSAAALGATKSSCVKMGVAAFCCWNKNMSD
jgi:hypothetical protein